MAEAGDPNEIRSKHKAISALFIYFLAQDRSQEIVGTFSRLASASQSGEFMWHRVRPYITPLLYRPTPQFPDLVIVLTSPYVVWHGSMQDEEAVARWATAVSAIPHTKEAGQAVVDALLQIASSDSLRPHIPVDIWAWLETQPFLSRKCLGLSIGTGEEVVHHVRMLGDVEILKSYLLLVWSEWSWIRDAGFTEMRISIREDFSGIEKRHHREDLIKRLDHVLGQLNRMLAYSKLSGRRVEESTQQKQYDELKRELLEVDKEANTPTRTLSRLLFFDPLTPVATYRIPLDLHVRSASPMSIISRLVNLTPLLHQPQPLRLPCD